ncbi:MAG: hypothetical protein GMKNLPBB_01118 [Myxococcota bacterium]|nr:hypothetical protein [Myxococcota bacterium]
MQPTSRLASMPLAVPRNRKLPAVESPAAAARESQASGVDTAGENYIRVGELAARTGKTVRALHLYEELGLLTPVTRTDGGFRLYDQDAVVRVKWIIRMQDAGFTLPMIQDILQLVENNGFGVRTQKTLVKVFEEKLLETRKQREHLAQVEGLLERTLRAIQETAPGPQGNSRTAAIDEGIAAEIIRASTIFHP